MKALLDFSQPFDYNLFVSVVSAYQQTSDYAAKQEAADVLQQFQDAPQSSQLCLEILSRDRTEQPLMVRFFGLSLLETFIRRNWYIIAPNQRNEIMTYAVALSTQCLAVDDVVRKKYLVVFTTLALYTYPEAYPTFLNEVLAMRSTPLDCINSAAILLTFLEDLQVRDELLSGQKAKIQQQLTGALPLIFRYILELERTAREQRNVYLINLLLKLTISVISFCDTIVKSDNLVPVLESFATFGLETMFFNDQEMFCLSLKVLGHIYLAMKPHGEAVATRLAVLFYRVADMVGYVYAPVVGPSDGVSSSSGTTGSFSIPPGVDPGIFHFAYQLVVKPPSIASSLPNSPAMSVSPSATSPRSPPLAGTNGASVQHLSFRTLTSDTLFSISFFFSTALECYLDYIEELACDSIPQDSINVAICLRQVATKSSGNEKLLALPLFKYRAVLQMLVAILVYQKANFDYLDIQLIEFFTSLAKKIQARSLRRPAFKRMEFYTDILTAVQRFSVMNIARPIEVLVYVDDYGNIMHRELDDSEQLNNFSTIAKLIEATTRAIKVSVVIKDLLAELSKQFSATLVNCIAWSLPSVARSIKSSGSLVVTTINHLIEFSSILTSAEHKICIASSIVYLCSQMPLFIDAKEIIFSTVLKKMLFFIMFPHEELQEMSVRCMALLLTNIKGTTFFDSPDFTDFLHGLSQIALQLPYSLVIVLYESISKRLNENSKTFMNYVAPLLEMLDGALPDQFPPQPLTQDAMEASIESLRRVGTILSILTGICEGIRGNTNGEIFVTSYSRFVPRTFKLYEFLQASIYYPIQNSQQQNFRNFLCTVRRCASSFLEMLIRATQTVHLRVWFLNTQPIGGMALSDDNSVRSRMLFLLKAYKEQIHPNNQTNTELLDTHFLAWAHALFEQISVLSCDYDHDELIQVYLNDVMGPTMNFLATLQFSTRADLASVFISGVCRMFSECSAYLQRQQNDFLRVFLGFLPPVLRAIGESNLFHKHYAACIKGLKAVLKLLDLRLVLGFQDMCVLFVDTIRLLNKSPSGSDNLILSDWWILLQRTNEPEMAFKVLCQLTPSISAEMVVYFAAGLTERSEGVIRDLFVFLRAIMWF